MNTFSISIAPNDSMLLSISQSTISYFLVFLFFMLVFRFTIQNLAPNCCLWFSKFDQRAFQSIFQKSISSSVPRTVPLKSSRCAILRGIWSTISRRTDLRCSPVTRNRLPAWLCPPTRASWSRAPKTRPLNCGSSPAGNACGRYR